MTTTTSFFSSSSRQSRVPCHYRKFSQQSILQCSNYLNGLHCTACPGTNTTTGYTNTNSAPSTLLLPGGFLRQCPCYTGALAAVKDEHYSPA
ncbi:hypothetical protein E2C01_006807 [Portunus trituberculatus]|uniref:Uncharacterized protein n=1 Tax=Portunus trituberculatus TaxID=210409 RepID=A0A5B7CZ50_PORTR|nr:hypothetical protein [Portunus trituberculatus]